MPGQREGQLPQQILPSTKVRNPVQCEQCERRHFLRQSLETRSISKIILAFETTLLSILSILAAFFYTKRNCVANDCIIVLC